jgi:amino acid permease
MPPSAVVALEIPDVVMELKALNTVKERAEGIPQSVFTTPLEMIAWLAALVVCLTGLITYANHDHGKYPLILSVASVVVLLLITFLFLPLWLRVVLDLALLIGLWISRSLNS